MSEAPDLSTDHPVDVLKWCAEQIGREMDPEAEAMLRAISDEQVEYIPIPTPAPTRIVEYPGVPSRGPVRVKGVIDAALSEGG